MLIGTSCIFYTWILYFYCGVLNSRLTVKLDELNFLHNEQNGFRKGRNTIDHISTLTTVIETRKLHKLSTYVAFIDFIKLTTG